MVTFCLCQLSNASTSWVKLNAPKRKKAQIRIELEMWANAQRDGRSAEYK